MKHFVTILLTCICTCITSTTVNAQDVIKQKTCSSDAIKRQADSIKASMAPSGYVVVREAYMTMESEYEMPVIVPLNEDVWYHIAFIGDGTSRLIELRMYDWEEKQVVYKRSKNDNIEDGNGANNAVLNYTYAPKFSEYHMIKPVQVNKQKKKDLCGYILLLKKVK